MTDPGTAADRAYMRRALRLAERGWGRVHPNPLVGAVVVRDGEVVGEGYHAEFGGPHAEVVALAAAGERAPRAGPEAPEPPDPPEPREPRGPGRGSPRWPRPGASG